jgi:hypothetical protein
MAALKSADELKAASEACLIDFLRTDLALCSTFADVAESELSNGPERALEAFKKAVQGCDIIEQFVGRIQDETKRREIEQNLDLLQSRLTAIQGQFERRSADHDCLS